MVSCNKQYEIRSDFDSFCARKGFDTPIRLNLTPKDYLFPLAPIMYIINELLKRTNISIEQIASVLKLDPYEKRILLSMSNELDTMNFFYLPSDVEYTRFRMHNHIVTVLNHLLSINGREPVCICLTNLQYAGPTSITYLQKVISQINTGYQNNLSPATSMSYNKTSNFRTGIKSNSNNTSANSFSNKRNYNTVGFSDISSFELLNAPNAILVFGFSSDLVMPNYPTVDWLEIETLFERNCTFIRPNDTEFEPDTCKYSEEWPEDNNNTVLISTPEEAIKRAHLLLNYFCCTEVIAVVKSTLKAIRTDNIEKQNRKPYHDEILYHIIGRAYLYNKDYEEALISFDLMYEKAQYQNNNDDACRAYIELAFTHIFRSDFESVLHFAEMAAHLGEVSMNMRLVALSNFCLFVAYDRSNIKYGLHKINNLLALLERQELIKEQIYVLRNTFAQVAHDSSITYTLAQDYCKRAVDLASRYGIKHELAAANHCRGIVLLKLNKSLEALHAYRLSEELYKSIEVPIDLTHVYNSIGYLLFEQEDYSKAQENYLKALRNSIKLNDYSEIAVTLYNIAELYITTGLYTNALRTLDILQDVMSIRGLINLPFHNMHHIMLYKALAYINVNEVPFAEQMLKRCYDLCNSLQMQVNETFLFTGITALIEAHNKNYESSMSAFKDLTLWRNKHINELSHQFNILYYKFAIKIFGLFDNFEQKLRFLRAGYEYASKNLLTNSKIILKFLWRSENIHLDIRNTISIETPMNELDQIIPLVEQERKVNTLWRQVHEMRLISMLHNFSLNVQTYQQLCAETVRLLSSHFNINGGMIYFLNEEGITDGISKDQKPVTLIHESNFSKAFIEFRYGKAAKFIQSHISHSFQEFNDITIGGMDIHRVVIYPLLDQDKLFGQMMLYTFDKKINNSSRANDGESINFIAQQLSSQLVLMIQRYKLIRVSTTDMLTGLYNRMEFNNQMNDIIKHLPPSEDIALGFIDLDNFKYYNDNLGHDIGDKLLIWFAELLNSNKVEGDVACRWGGDEFLLLMKNCKAEEAFVRMQHILDTLKAKKGYKNEIEEFLGHEVTNLPERYYLACSIGVMDSSSLPRPFTEADLLTHADAALYEVKRTGKGRVLNFENMTHEADDQIMESNR